MAPRRSSRGNIPLQTPPESDLQNFRRSSRGIASTAQTSPEYNPSNLRRSSRGTIAATEFNPPNPPDTQHSQEFQSNPDEYEDPEDQEFANCQVQTSTTGKRKRAGSSAQKQRKIDKAFPNRTREGIRKHWQWLQVSCAVSRLKSVLCIAGSMSRPIDGTGAACQERNIHVLHIG
jgi:hypothetical protein